MSIVLSHLGKDAYKIYAKAKPQERESILNVLSDLEANKEALKLYFTPQRGAVIAYSDSPAPVDTESPQQDSASDESIKILYSVYGKLNFLA
jgi:hypothetical protein